MSRSRQRNDERTIPIHFTNNVSGGEVWFDAQTATFFESFIDVTGLPGGIHPCNHSKVTLDYFLGSYSFQDSAPGNYVTVNPYRYGIPPAGTIESLFGPPSSVQLAGFTDRAFEALSTQVPQEVSLPNFLYEFREIGSLIPELGESMAKTVSGGFLNYSFGWKPLIGDIQKLSNLMSTVRARIEYLKSTYGRETRLSHSEAFEVEGDLMKEIGGSRYYRDSAKGILRAGGYLFHLLKNLDSLEGTLRAAAGALGLNNPLGVVWEAIPFSFVLDWFGRIQSAIGKTAVQPFEGVWEIHRLCWSFTVSGTWHRDVYLGAGSIPERVEQLRGTWQQYGREPGLPVSDSLLASTALDTRQQMLAAALIHQSVR
jgi:hypothetical protein